MPNEKSRLHVASGSFAFITLRCYGCVDVPPVFGEAGAVLLGAAGVIGAGAGACSVAAGAVVEDVVVGSVVDGALICIQMKPPTRRTAMMAAQGAQPADLRAASGVVRSSGRSGLRLGSRGMLGSKVMFSLLLLWGENAHLLNLFQIREKDEIYPQEEHCAAAIPSFRIFIISG